MRSASCLIHDHIGSSSTIADCHCVRNSAVGADSIFFCTKERVVSIASVTTLPN